MRLVLLFVLALGVAHASPRKAKRLKKAADKAFVAGDYPRAVELLEKAYAQDPKPGYIANKAFVLDKMGRFADAAGAFEQFLASNPVETKARKAREMLGRLKPAVRVESTPAGASASLGARVLGQTPVDTRLVVGRYDLRIEQKGFKPWSGALEVKPGEEAVLKATLEPIAVAAPKPKPKPLPAVTASRPVEPAGADHLLYGGITAGVGLVAVGAGVFLLSEAGSEVDARDASTSRSDWDDHQASAETLNTSAWAAIGIGGAAVAGGVLWMLMGGDDDQGVAVGPTGANAWVRF